MTDVIVIGGGVNGLVAAAWLAKRRLSVTVLEQREVAGGAAVTTEFSPGFRGPTLSHALGPISRDVMKAFRLDRAGLEFLTPDPALTTVGRDGRAIVFHRDQVLTAGSINAVSPGDAVRWGEFLKVTQRLSALAATLGRHAPPSLDEVTARDWWRLLKLGRKARALGRRDLARVVRWLPMAVADVSAEWFSSELLQAAISAHAIFGNPAGPWSAGTGAMLLQRLSADPMPVGSGVTLRGGPGALADVLVKIAGRAGARVRTDARTTRIVTRKGKASGVVLDNGEELDAKVILAAVDPKRTFIDLIDPSDLPPTFLERVRHIRARGVTAKINLALAELPVFAPFVGDPLPLRGRVLIAPDVDYLERAFDATKYGEMSAEPWLEIAIPSMADSSLAAENRHVMSIYVHFAPRHLRHGEWDDKREALYQAVMRVLEPYAPTLSSLVVGREVLTPDDLERRWGLSGGHIFHGEPALDQSWVARPLLGWSQYRSPIPSLYLGSAGVHPGGGLTGLPGLLAARTVAHDLRRQ